MGDDLKIYGAAGPYLGFGVAGKSKFEGFGQSDETDIKWGSSEEDDYKPLDFGLNIGAGVAIGQIQAGLTYGLGLANLATETGNGFKINNRVLGVTVAYKFGGRD